MLNFRVCLVVPVLLAASIGLAQPQPRAFSGTFSATDVVSIFGSGFGEIPGSPDNSQKLTDISELRACAVVTTEPVLTRDSFQEFALVEMWSPNEIRLKIRESGLTEQSPYFLFLVDPEGQTGAPIGPWKVGMGIAHGPKRQINLIEEDGQLRIEGDFPGGTPGRPGVPIGAQLRPTGQPVLLQAQGEFFQDSVVDIIGHGFGPGEKNVDSVLGPGEAKDLRSCVVLGDDPVMENCTWLERMEILSWANTTIQLRFHSTNLQPGGTGFLYAVDGEGDSSPGLAIQLEVDEDHPGPPQNSHWVWN